VATRVLTRDEIELIWTIDRSEVYDHIFEVVEGRLKLVPAHFEIASADRCVVRASGRKLFGKAAEAARALGAKALYISAIPTENTVNFYLHLGASLAADPDPDLFRAEPDDVHLIYPL
jgi:hypothetical protein